MTRNNPFLLLCAISSVFLISTSSSCKKSTGGGGTNNPPPNTGSRDVEAWMTTSDQSVLLQKQTTVLSFGTTANSYPNIEVDTTQTFQTVDGFGYTLTGGSVSLINALSQGARTTLLRELFSNDDNAIGISYLRLPIGASDLSPAPYTYDDLPAGQTDPTLAQFSLGADATSLVPLLQQIRQVNPSIKLLATPWSAPAWMKSNGSLANGSLLPQYYAAYAQYFVKYLQAMAAAGLTIDAITPQNEPENGNNNPSLVMTAAEQASFIKNNLGPALQNAGLSTKIIIFDHNADHPNYPLDILNDAAARNFVNGTAFHLYAGNISALSQVHAAYPDKAIYFTEQYTASTGDFGGDLRWHMRNVIIGSMRNWSRVALEWNLANDPSYGPHTAGGCNTCKGALTIGNGGSITRNVAYYIVAQISKFVPPGSVRIASDNYGDLQSVAFKTPAGKKVLVMLNDGAAGLFNIKFNGKWVQVYLPTGAAGTYIW